MPKRVSGYGVCSFCQESDIGLIEVSNEIVLVDHDNQAGETCTGTYSTPETVYGG